MPCWSLVTGRAGAVTPSDVPAVEDPLVEISPGLRVAASGDGAPTPKAGAAIGGDECTAGWSSCDTTSSAGAGTIGCRPGDVGAETYGEDPGGWTEADSGAEFSGESSPASVLLRLTVTSPVFGT